MAGNNGMIHSIDADEQFFLAHPDRQAHIRLPKIVSMIDAQRRVAMVPEMQGEFWSLGEHDRKRRRVLLWRVPSDRWQLIPNHDGVTQPIMKVPFLAYSDETIEDTDEVLLPILEQIMEGELGYAAR